MSKSFIITDETPVTKVSHPTYGWEQGRGLDLSQKTEAGYEGVAEPFPTELIIPRNEWQARIQEREERKATLKGNLLAGGVKVKDQNGTNLCWANAPTFCMEITRFQQGEKYVPLSPASVASPITNFRNRGGWGRDALQQLVTAGAVPCDLWPANAIDRQYATATNKQTALNYRVAEWWVLDPSDLDHLVSVLLRGLPVAVGYNWWSHEVSAVDAVWIDGAIAIQIANSWGESWQDHGYGIIQGRRMLPDDAVCPRTAIAY